MRKTVLLLGVGIASAGVAVACAGIIGADAPVLAPSEAGARDAEVADTYRAPPAEPDAATCPTGTKLCAGGCVEVNDPAYGCDPKLCLAPCSTDHGTPKCTENGTCGILKCDQQGGWADCNHLAKDGCETNLLDPATCTKCDVQCDLTQVCDLKNGGCSTACGAGLKNCDRSCVDVDTNALNCGDCGVKCPAPPANGVGKCSAKKCGIECNAGYAECTPGQCVALKTFYRDADGDGFGTTAQTEQKCAPSPGFVAVAGDCHDGNPAVFPGQTKFFGTPYDSPRGPSYDYNCDGVETAQNAYKAFTTCSDVCKETGLVAPTQRTGPGVDTYCGATTLRACNTVQIEVPIASSPVHPRAAPTAIPANCNTADAIVPALGCR